MKRKLLLILALCIFAICSAFAFIACNGNSGNQDNHEDKTHTVHTFNERSTGNKYLKSAATCTESAVFYYSCSCGETGESTFEYGKPNGHREVVDEAVKPTCTETGLTEGKHCSVCKDVLVEQTEIKANGHTEVTDKAVEPTCTKKGKSEGKHCSVCKTVLVEQTEIKANGHTEAIDDAVEPTCIRNGKTEGKHCSVCKDVFVAQNEIEAQGHLFENEKCKICETPQPTDGLQYTLSKDGKYYSLSGIGTATEKEIIISDFYNGKPVTAIADNALKDCSSITGITIPDGITAIGYNAFLNCNKLTSITIGCGASEIKGNAFNKCNKLSSITVSENNTAYASIDGILYDKAITRFIHVPKAIEGEIVIPDGITKIGESAHSISENAFSGCSGLTGITIPDSVTEIRYGAFSNCSGLTSIYYTGDIASWCTISGLVYLMHYGKENKKLFINGNEVIGNLIIPDGVTSISDYAFYQCSSLTGIKIPNGVTEIGPYSFYGCSGLKSVTIPDGATSIGDYAFFQCRNLTNVTIPDSVSSIGYNAFVVCEGLTGISIGSGVTNIDSTAFDGCIKLANITVSENNTAYASQDGILYNKAETEIILVPQAVKGDIVLPDSLTSIGHLAFANCSKLTSITIPDSVIDISYAFHDCSGLMCITVSDNNPAYASVDGILYNKAKTEIIHVPQAIKGEVVIPDGITSIDNWAFNGCRGMTHITIAESVTEIGAFAFNGCSGLTSMTIAESVTSFGDDAFYLCENLSSITFNGTIAQWRAIKGSNGIGGFTDPDMIITCTDGKLDNFGDEITE